MLICMYIQIIISIFQADLTYLWLPAFLKVSFLVYYIYNIKYVINRKPNPLNFL